MELISSSHHYLANYEIEQEIGKGSFATVYVGYEKVHFIHYISIIFIHLHKISNLDDKGKSCCEGSKHGKIKQKIS